MVDLGKRLNPLGLQGFFGKTNKTIILKNF